MPIASCGLGKDHGASISLVKKRDHLPLDEDELKPFVVSPHTACRLLNVKLTKFYGLLPLLESYLDGRRRQITLRSLEALVERRLAGSQAESQVD